MKQKCDHEWIVYSSAIKPGYLMLYCDKCDAPGTVQQPTKKEWGDAFCAPSKPYRWMGGDERVVVDPKNRQ